VRGKINSDHLGDGHQALTGVRLGRSEGEAAAALLAQLPGDPNGADLDLDIGSTQRGQFTPAQTAEDTEQHQGAVPATDRISQGVDLGNRQDRALG